MGPELIDFESIAPLVMAALERRQQARRSGEMPRQIPALVIARRFGIRRHGSDDSQKRGVRLLMEQLRQQGAPILANFRGYYLAGDAADWAAYSDFRRRMGLANLIGAAHAQRAESMTGQLPLFGEGRKPAAGIPSAARR